MRILVTAIGSMAAEAVIASLARRGNTKIFGCNIHPYEWTAASRLVDRFYQVPPARDCDAYIASLIEICRQAKVTHVIALTDPEVDVLSENSDRFSAIGTLLCTPPAGSVKKARDKLEIYNIFKSDIHIKPIPTFNSGDPGVLGLDFPLIAKPRTGRSSEGKIDLMDKKSLEFWRQRLPVEQYIIQPRIEGSIFVTDIVFDKTNNMAAWLTRQELLRTANGAGITVRIHPDHPCGKMAWIVSERLGLTGCVNIEFLVSGDEIFLMDVNPRFSAGVAFSLRAGYDMIDNHLRCFTGENILPPPAVADAIYTKGFLEYAISNGENHETRKP